VVFLSSSPLSRFPPLYSSPPSHRRVFDLPPTRFPLSAPLHPFPSLPSSFFPLLTSCSFSLPFLSLPSSLPSPLPTLHFTSLQAAVLSSVRSFGTERKRKKRVLSFSSALGSFDCLSLLLSLPLKQHRTDASSRSPSHRFSKCCGATLFSFNLLLLPSFRSDGNVPANTFTTSRLFTGQHPVRRSVRGRRGRRGDGLRGGVGLGGAEGREAALGLARDGSGTPCRCADWRWGFPHHWASATDGDASGGGFARLFDVPYLERVGSPHSRSHSLPR
jgi:hypothetical protein